ncbi:MAG: class I SAM-dependent methyltransferase [Alphaproteobacteria bacterium]|nr:class I SAM-dependent methyltransferase [Alphaproteobacteria bacterium]
MLAPPSYVGLIPTLNKMGYAFENLTAYGEAFLEYCEIVDGPVLDVGAAYGIASIRALKKGAYVIANDIEPRHLEAIKRKTSSMGRYRLNLLLGKFPYIELSDNSLGAILMSQVLHFLPHYETSLIASKMFSWLKPSGKAFITTASPYVEMFRGFIPIFESRKKNNIKNPGLIEDLTLYAGSRKLDLPEQMNLFDPSILEHLMRSAGFIIEKSEFVARPDFPPEMQMDGRENVGIIVQKPF